MNRTNTLCLNIIPSVMFGLLFMSNLQADETAFDKLGDAIAFDQNAPSLAETVFSLNHTTLVYAPGSKVQYSNAGIAVVDRVLERVTGRTFAQVLDENILQPLGMTHSALTPEESKIFVANPAEGSRHNRGCAIDLTLYDLKTGEPVEMVGLYDEMSPRSYPHYPGGSSLQRWHRETLIGAMEAEGFNVYAYEWWRFDFAGWEDYRILADTFEALHRH